MVDFKKALKRAKRLDLNPSSADRWTTCTASPKFIYDNWDRLPEEERKWADEGTTAHEVAAALLQDRKPNLQNCPSPIQNEMHWHGWNYAEYIANLRQEGSKLMVERKLPLFYLEGRNAIIDAAVLNPDSLHIIDFKYGEGIIVSPVENLQATIYAKTVVWASGIWNGKPFFPSNDFPVFVHIYQPRSRNAEESPSHTWQTTWGVIEEKGREIFEAANFIQEGFEGKNRLVEFKPSEKACQWCPAKGFCEARQKELVKDLEPLAVIDSSPRPSGKVLTEKQLAALVLHGDEIKKWVDDAQAYALQHMRAGGKIPGCKLVLSRGGHRYWSDPQKAAKLLLKETILKREEIFVETIVKPPVIEKLLGKGKFPGSVYNLISKPPGQPVIAAEDDPRDTYLVDGSKEFENLDAPAGVDLAQF